MGLDRGLTEAPKQGSGEPLDRTTRDAMEAGFSADFGDVRVHSSPRSACMNRLLGSRAFTVGNHIFFGQSQYRPQTPQGRLLLAHELAHVAQKRLGGTTTPAQARAAEVEAHAAASAVTQGRRYRCTIPLPPNSPSCWGEAGHYYTVNFVLQAAGLEPVQAGQIAFFAQMGDEVVELDAVEQGLEWGKLQAGKSAAHAGGAISRAVADKFLNERMRVAKEIGMGLHCLTGAEAECETGWRASILERIETGDDDLKLGLAVHAFGDSYAHRDIGERGKKMYPPIIGHAKIMATDALSGKVPSRAHAEIPDHIDERPDLYKEYGRQLYAIARHRWKTPLAKGISLARLTDALEEISNVRGDDDQIFKIRSLSAKLCHPIDRKYFPELQIRDGDDYKDCVPFDRFIAIHKLQRSFLERARGYARAWSLLSASPAPARKSKVSDYDIVETAPAAHVEQPKTHVVKSGESLSLIARQHYGTTENWPAIWKANRSVIGNNPNLIQPGMTLVLP